MLDDLAALGVDEIRRRLEADAGGARRLRASSRRFGIPETIQHDDLHDGQVFVQDGRYLLLDWGDACVSHPFFTLAVTLDGVIAWGVDDVEALGDDGAVPRRLPRRRSRTTSAAISSPPRTIGATARLALPRRQQPPARQPSDDEHDARRLRMFLDGRA